MKAEQAPWTKGRTPILDKRGKVIDYADVGRRDCYVCDEVTPTRAMLSVHITGPYQHPEDAGGFSVRALVGDETILVCLKPDCVAKAQAKQMAADDAWRAGRKAAWQAGKRPA